MTEQGVPHDALITAKALRTASNWLPDKYRDMLRESADLTERNWDGGCCPVCEETWCDAGCPLEDVRGTSLGLSLSRLKEHGL